MAIRAVPSPFATIRAAISAAKNGDTISIAAGSYSISAPGYTNTFSYSAAPSGITGFINGVDGLLYQGAGNSGDASVTTVTGDARLYQAVTDGTPPVSLSFRSLDFSYSAGSGYLLQTGNFGVPVANTRTKSITLDNLSFRGSHAGNTGANGNYSAVLGIQNFTLNNSVINLTGQSGFNVAAGTGGSAFLMLNGGTGGALGITGNTFNESGYRSALSIFDSSGVTISGNTFLRTLAGSRTVREAGEKLKDTSGSVQGNSFLDGAFLAVERVSGGSVAVTGNTFAQFLGASPNPVGGTRPVVGIVLEGAQGSSALSSVQSNTFSYVAPFGNLTSTAITIGAALGAGTNTYIDPITNASRTFQAYHVGGIGADTISGTTANDFFAGGQGNDRFNSGQGSDYALFNTIGAGNVDVITGFSSADRIILDSRVFQGISATFKGATPSSIGAVNANQIENGAANVATRPSTRIIYNRANGSLFYDRDGSGGAYAPIQFASLFSSQDMSLAYRDAMIGFNGSSNLSAVNIGII